MPCYKAGDFWEGCHFWNPKGNRGSFTALRLVQDDNAWEGVLVWQFEIAGDCGQTGSLEMLAVLRRPYGTGD